MTAIYSYHIKNEKKNRIDTVFDGVKPAVFLEEKISKGRGAAFTPKE